MQYSLTQAKKPVHDQLQVNMESSSNI